MSERWMVYPTTTGIVGPPITAVTELASATDVEQLRNALERLLEADVPTDLSPNGSDWWSARENARAVLGSTER